MTEREDFEEWRAVPGFEGFYDVSNRGRVRSLRRNVPHRNGTQSVRGRILALQKNRGGYLAIQLWKSNHMKRPLVHTLVLRAFIGPPPDNHETNHLDGDKTNNHITNLEYVTRSENNQHAYDLGLRASGEDHYFAKLTADEVREMRRLHSESGLGCRRLARRYGVSKSAVQLILNGTNWRHLL